MSASSKQPRVSEGDPSRKGGQWKQTARPGGVGSLDDAPAADPVLAKALETYGITLADVPPDHEGVTLAERWQSVREDADLPEARSVQAALTHLLGHPDFGRHRSGPDLEWRRVDEPTFDYDADHEGVDLADDPRWDDPAWRVVATVYTRNGGGNRECWCNHEDDTHDAGCLAPRIAALQEHEDYLDDTDVDGDRTYAEFAFAVRDTEVARRAVRDAATEDRRLRAASMLARVADGTAPPWIVMPSNPATLQHVQTLREAIAQPTSTMSRRTAEALRIPERSGGYGSGQWHKVDLTPEHLEDLERARAFLADPLHGTPPEPQAHYARFAYGIPGKVEPETVERWRAALAKEADSIEVDSVLEAGGLTPAIERALRAHQESAFGGKYDQSKGRQVREEIDKARDKVAQAIEAAAPHVAEVREHERLRKQYETAQADLIWPGPLGTAPQRLVPVKTSQPTSDPF